MTEPGRRSVTLPISAYLRDHHFEGRAILPAVEALNLLAETVAATQGVDAVRYSRDAEFRSFLPLPPDASSIEVQIATTPSAGGRTAAELLSQVKLGKVGISRSKMHVRASFGIASRLDRLPLDMAASLEGPCFAVEAKRLYAELVPFGPAYHNAMAPIWLAPDGAIGTVAAPASVVHRGSLGSPFPLDAAFHLACAWSQRYAGVVAFPIGYDERFVVRPTEPGQAYFCRVAPRGSRDEIMTFDLWLYHSDGSLAEAVLGVKMTDVSNRRAQAPEWIKAAPSSPALESWGKYCAGSVVLDLAAVTPLAAHALSAHEQTLAAKMGEKRRHSFTGARIAMKRLARRLFPALALVDAAAIDTVLSDERRPGVSAPSPALDLNFSAAHDSRYVIAVAGKSRFGVDVERLADKMLRTTRLYMSDAEKALAQNSSLGALPAAARVWTLKEAAAKALDVPLAPACRLAQVGEIGATTSRAQINGKTWIARHAVIDDHVFTLLTEQEAAR